MGQPIRLLSTVVAGDVAVFDTDRSVTGQDGAAFAPGTDPAGGFPAALAARIFEADDRVGHVFVASNQVVARRESGWDDAAVEAVGAVITRFFVFYDETIA
jgi:hypothetical protein